MTDEDRRLIFRRRGEDGEEIDDRFDVELPKKALLLLVALYTVFLFIQYYYMNLRSFEFAPSAAVSVLILLALTLVPLLLWAGLGPAIAERLVLRWVGKVEKNKIPSPNQILVGFPAATKDLYYVEANSMDVKMGNFFQVIDRIKEVVFLSIGICILTAGILGTFFFDRLERYWDVVMGDPYYGTNELVLDTAIWLGPFALLLLFMVIPLFWIAEDMQIYRIDRFQDTKRVGWFLRTGLLAKVLGFIGIIFAYDVANGYAVEVHGPDAAALTIYATTFETFFLIFLACAGAPFLVATIYLLKYHEVWVNNIRIKASQFLPVGTMEVSRVENENLHWLGQEGEVKMVTDRLVCFLKTPKGKIVLIALLLLGIAGTMFMGFVFTGVWSDPIGLWREVLPFTI